MRVLSQFAETLRRSIRLSRGFFLIQQICIFKLNLTASKIC